ncbi:MAG: O-antigen ligase family protein [Clostridia bacterium]|nr:O-antigen ligase family protein [Clostridia bacterium]
MKFLKNKEFYHLLLQIGIILFPVQEMYRSFFGDTVQIAGFAAEEILILLWVGLLFAGGVFVCLCEKRKKPLIFVGIYAAVFLVFTLLHALNASRFNASLLPSAQPSLIREAYYTVRMYGAPLFAAGAAVLLKTPAQKIFSALKAAAWILCLGIVIPDLFGFSFASYVDGNVVVNGGFFSWFSLGEDADFARYTAKGLFSSANDVAAVLFGLTPFAAYSCLKNKKPLDYILLLLVGLSSIMVGTKIGAYGFFLALGATLLFAALGALMKKEKNSLSSLLISAVIFIVLVPLLLMSPGKRLQDLRNRQAQGSRPTDSIDEVEDLPTEEDADFSEEETRLLEEYVTEHHWDHFINPWFLELYPVSEDPEFWTEIITRPNHLNSDSRAFKIHMIRRIVARNENPSDALFGIGFTSGIPYAEKDYVNQYYLFGLVGILVLFWPFAALFALSCKEVLLRLFRRKNFLLPFVPALSLFAFFVTAYFAGHVFDTQFSTYFLCFSLSAVIPAVLSDENA